MLPSATTHSSFLPARRQRCAGISRHRVCLCVCVCLSVCLSVTRRYCIKTAIVRSRKQHCVSWPGWLTYSGWFTHINGHPSATSQAQDRESSPAKDRRTTAVPRNQPINYNTDKSSASDLVELQWIQRKQQVGPLLVQFAYAVEREFQRRLCNQVLYVRSSIIHLRYNTRSPKSRHSRSNRPL